MVLNPYRLVAESQKRVVKVQRKTFWQIRAMRRQFCETKRDEFRQYYTGYKKPPLDIHHILPIALGGGNDWCNLCLVPKDLHEVIHEYINEQLDGMNTGDVREINLPILSTRKVWNPYAL